MQNLPTYTIGEAARILGLSIETLRRYDRAGKIKARRTPGGKRFFTQEDVEFLKVFVKKRYQNIEIPNTTPLEISHPKSEYKFSNVNGFLLFSTLILLVASLYFFSLTPLPNQAARLAARQVLGVKDFIAPALEESAPIGSLLSKAGSFFRGGSFVVLFGRDELEVGDDLNVKGKAIIAKDIEGLGNIRIKGTAIVERLKTNIIDPYLIENDGDVQSFLEIRTLPSALGSSDIVFTPGGLEKLRIKEGGDVVFSGSLSGIDNITATGTISGGDTTIGKLSTSGTINGNTFEGNKLVFLNSNPNIYPATTNSGISINANGKGVISLGSSSTGNIEFFSSNNKITSSGNLVINGSYSVGGNQGQTKSACGASQYLGGIAVTGGIITTLGNCTTVSSKWSGLTDPDANLSLTMAAFTTTFTYNASTGTSNLFTLTDTASNTGTGYLLNLTTASSSTLLPFRVQARGNTIIDTTATGGVTIGNATSAQAVTIDAGTATLNLGNSNNAKTINIGTGTAIDTINIGTGATGADVIRLGSSVADLALTDAEWSITTGGVLTLGTTVASVGEIRLANGVTIAGRNAANTADITLMDLNASNDINIGNNASNIRIRANLIANADNLYDIGASGANRPRSIYTGTDVVAGQHVISGGNGALIGRGIGTASFGTVNQVQGEMFADTTNDTFVIQAFNRSTGARKNVALQTNLVFQGDNTYDIGASGATRPRTIYPGTQIALPAGTVSTPSILIGQGGGAPSGIFQVASNTISFAPQSGTKNFDFDTAGYNMLNGVSNGTFRTDIGGTGTAFAVCHDTQTGADNQVIVDCTSAPGADYAEMYPVEAGIEYGDVVTTGTELVNTYEENNGQVDWNKVKGKVTRLVKSSKGYQGNLIGIVSDNYGDFTSAGHNIKAEDNPYPVALNGRVPVKVSVENGTISSGDFLTSSATKPGFAMKATKPGRTIGVALEPYDGPSTGSTNSLQASSGSNEKIMVFVNPSWYDPSIYIAENGDLSIKVDNIETKKLTISTDTNKEVLTASSSARVDGSYIDISSKQQSILSRLDSLEKLVLSLSSLSVGGVSSSSPQLISILSSIESKEATISGTLNVLGKTTVSDLGITGKITNGLLTINGLASQGETLQSYATIDTLSGDLHLQSIGLGGVNILAGKVTIDKDGNLTVQKTLTAKKYNVDTRDAVSPSAGSVVIPAGTTSITVQTTALTAESLIFVTPETPAAVGASKKDATTISISLKDPLQQDLKINWWIVN